MRIKRQKQVKILFSEQDLKNAAGAVREAMLNALPEPETCYREFSVAFRVKIEKLLRKEKIQYAVYSIRRCVVAIIMLFLIGGGIVLTVDAEARADFFKWVREVYENSIVYDFFNGTQTTGLPVYELGWVPEGYVKIFEYRDEWTYSSIYQKGEDVTAAFVFDYSYGHSGTQVEILGDISKYEYKKINVEGISVDYYQSLDGTETNNLIWVLEEEKIVFSINGYLNEADMLHIFKEIFLVKTPK